MLPVNGLLLIGLLATAPPRAAIAPDGALLSVEAPPPGTTAALREDGVAVVRDLGGYLLVVTGAEGRGRIEARGLRTRLLDASVAGKTFYTVETLGKPAGPVRAAGRVLREDDREAVLEIRPERAAALAAVGYEIARVFLRPVRPAPPRPSRPGLRAVTWNPLIDAMVRSVSGSAIDGRVQRLQDFGTRFCRSDSAWAAADWIRAELEQAGADSVSFHTWDPGYSPNVVAVLRGWYEPETIIVVGGHYDSISSGSSAPGADDNASGTALVLEAARVLGGHRFDCTLVFVAFGGEELGLFGSEAWAAAAAARGDQVAAMINADMVGYLAPGDTPDLDVITDNASAWLRDLAGDVGAAYVPDLAVIDGVLPGGATSDHASFWAHGYHAVQLWEDDDHSPYLHTASDVVGTSYNSGALAEGFARLAVAMAAELAVPCPVAIAHAPLADVPVPGACRVTATIAAELPLAPDSLCVHWSDGGAWRTETFAPTGVPDEYEAWMPPMPTGARVEYWLSAEDASGVRATDPRTAPGDVYSFYVGQPVIAFTDDAEADRGWTLGLPTDDATTGRWIRADPVGTWDLGLPVQPEDDCSPAGVCCFVTGNAAAGLPVGVNDVDGGRTTLLSPVLDLSAWPGGRVEYRRWYVNDTPNESPTDVWTVDVSSDGGGTWTPIETCGASDRTWRLIRRDIVSYVPLTSAVQFRFVASDESTGSFVEAAVDEFAVTVFPPAAVAAMPAAPAIGPPLALELPAPNPSSGACRIRFTAPAGAPATLCVLDVGGRAVATLVRKHPAAGTTEVSWDGLDARGRRVGAGVYFIRLDAGGETRTTKLVRVR